MMNWQALDSSILGPALIAGLLVLSTHVPLGRLVLNRGIIFIDLAVAQIAGIGVIAAGSFGLDESAWQVQAAAVTTAVFGAFILRWTEKHFASVQEAMIGVIFVLAATLSVLLLAKNPHGGEYLKEILVGQILWVTYDELIPAALIYAILLFCWFGLKIGEKLPSAFYLILALVVTVSVQLVGVYLVFASLIIPALATRNLFTEPCKGVSTDQRLEEQTLLVKRPFFKRSPLVLAFLLGALSYALGLVGSAVFDLPSGPVIVWCLAIVGGIGSLWIGCNNPDKEKIGAKSSG